MTTILTLIAHAFMFYGGWRLVDDTRNFWYGRPERWLEFGYTMIVTAIGLFFAYLSYRSA